MDLSSTVLTDYERTILQLDSYHKPCMLEVGSAPPRPPRAPPLAHTLAMFTPSGLPSANPTAHDDDAIETEPSAGKLSIATWIERHILQ